jgi:hypothetical protein
MTSTVASAQAYAAPVYGSEAPTYSAPVYEAPATTYGAPATTYTAPTLNTTATAPYPGTDMNGYPTKTAETGIVEDAKQFATMSNEYAIAVVGKKKIPGWVIIVIAIVLIILFALLINWIFGECRCKVLSSLVSESCFFRLGLLVDLAGHCYHCRYCRFLLVQLYGQSLSFFARSNSTLIVCLRV